MGNHAKHYANFQQPFLYTLEIKLNLLESNPAYPKNPKTLGEKIRKARMDEGLLVRELAELIEVTEDTVINWELRGRRPRDEGLKKIKAFLEA